MGPCSTFPKNICSPEISPMRKYPETRSANILSQLRFAAIDIGSNAVRLLLASVFEHNGKPTFKKMSLTRMPIRLGTDAFSLKRISAERADELVKAMR